MAHPDLVAHNDQFPREIVELGTGMWTALGFAASNAHMIEGHESVTIIDTTESTAAAEAIATAFRARSSKPVGRIIYTHSHRDHISGASVFRTADQPVLASHRFASDLVGVDEARIAPIRALGTRTQAQFGIGLPPEARVNLGCGPGDRPMQGLGAGFVPPTELIEAEGRIDLDGVEAELLFVPGETADHMAVWLPETKTLFPGDNWYHAFPNLYAIRGTPYRDFSAWSATLTQLAGLRAEVMAPGHTRPVFGAERIFEVLTSTRDAIDHVMAFTADAMDRGLSLDDIAATISLPVPLRDKPWLKEFYGKLGWSARAFAVGTLGWYDGNPTHLGTLSDKARAAHLRDLAGGTKALKQSAETTEDLQWRLELCDHLLALGEDMAALKAETMETLAETEINATARNTYLWEAKRLRDG